MLCAADTPSSTTSPTARRWIAFAAALLLALALPLAGSAEAMPGEGPATSPATEEIERPSRAGPVQRHGQSVADRVSDLGDRAPAVGSAALVDAWEPSGLDPSEQLGVTPLRGPPQP